MQLYEYKQLDSQLLDGANDKGFFRSINICFSLGAICFFSLVFAQVYRHLLLERGISYREVQGGALVVFFICWIVFSILCKKKGISTKPLSIQKIVNILSNKADSEVIVGSDERKHIFKVLFGFDERWDCFPLSEELDPEHDFSMIMTGPNGLFLLTPLIKHFLPSNDKHVSNSFENKLIDIATHVSESLAVETYPILLSFRSKHNFVSISDRIFCFNAQEFESFALSRPEVLSEKDLKKLQRKINSFDKIEMIKQKI